MYKIIITIIIVLFIIIISKRKKVMEKIENMTIDFFIKNFLLKIEGSKVVKEPPDSKGRERYSKYGIIKYSKEEAEKITEDEAIEFYKNEFNKFVKKYNYPFPLNFIMFDTYVNMGARGLNSILSNLPSDFSISDFIRERIKLYEKIAQNEKYKKYLSGWINRVYKLKNLLNL